MGDVAAERGCANGDLAARREAGGADEWSRGAEWVARAERLAPLVDGIEYFRAVREALIRARQQVLIVGWDLHSEIDLLRGSEAEEAVQRDGYPARLADLLERVLGERPELHVSLLIWEGASLFALERQHFPRMKRPWAGHERLELVWDRSAPAMASQHQKMVVVDDRVAFVGGLDLTQGRWDDHDHAPEDRRRRQPGLLRSYGPPYHDLMLALDGEAARVLGHWCRERWHRVTACRLPVPHDESEADAWSPSAVPLLRGRRVAFALTQPESAEHPEKRQVEQTYLAQIASARRLVFIENQYFTSPLICDALCERLREPDGPEVVMILPYGCPGTIQCMALDPIRDRLLQRLRAADAGSRLGVYWPTLQGGRAAEERCDSVYVHAKSMVIDDELLRIGSANLACRSMGVDTEIDAFTRVDDREGRRALARYRHRLLAYLLGVEPERVAAAERREDSCVRAIEALRHGDRSLHPFDHRADTFQGFSLPPELADPERPLDATEAMRVAEEMARERGLGERVARVRNKAIGAVRRNKRSLVVGAAALLAGAIWLLQPR